MERIVITGACGGMGKAVVQRCLQDGFSVLAIDHRPEDLNHLKQAHADTVDVLCADVADARIGHSVLEHLPEPSGVHGIVHLVGVSRGASIETITEEDWQTSFEVNVGAAMRINRALVPYLTARGQGSIVHVASPVAVVGARKVSYSASKAALLGLNVAMARNLGPRGIRVNALLPGPTITRMTQDWSEDKRKRIAQEPFLKRLCTPEDIAGAISFLLGPDSSFVTGTVLDVTGGSAIGVHG